MQLHTQIRLASKTKQAKRKWRRIRTSLFCRLSRNENWCCTKSSNWSVKNTQLLILSMLVYVRSMCAKCTKKKNKQKHRQKKKKNKSTSWGIHKVRQLGDENGQFWHNRASNAELGMKFYGRKWLGPKLVFFHQFRW